MVLFTSSMGFMEGKTPPEIKQKFSDVSGSVTMCGTPSDLDDQCVILRCDMSNVIRMS
jgi:hypothetical protein